MKKITKLLILIIPIFWVVPLFSLSSCSKEKYIPFKYFNIENNVLKGFKSGYHPEDWKKYNTIMIPSNVQSISNDAFNSDFTDDSVTLKLTFEKNSACKEIGRRAFKNDVSLVNLDFKNTSEITWNSDYDSYNNTFYNCKRIIKIYFSNEQYYIPGFEGSNFSKIYIYGDNLHEISSEAFKNCSNLESVSISCHCIGKIGSSAFQNDYNLYSYKDGNWGWNINDCSYRSTAQVETCAFYGCEKLTSLYICNYNYAKYGYGSSCFNMCRSVSTIYLDISKERLKYATTLTNLPNNSNMIIHIPDEEDINQYKNEINGKCPEEWINSGTWINDYGL